MHIRYFLNLIQQRQSSPEPASCLNECSQPFSTVQGGTNFTQAECTNNATFWSEIVNCQNCIIANRASETAFGWPPALFNLVTECEDLQKSQGITVNPGLLAFESHQSVLSKPDVTTIDITVTEIETKTKTTTKPPETSSTTLNSITSTPTGNTITPTPTGNAITPTPTGNTITPTPTQNSGTPTTACHRRWIAGAAIGASAAVIAVIAAAIIIRRRHNARKKRVHEERNEKMQRHSNSIRPKELNGSHTFFHELQAVEPVCSELQVIDE